METATIILLSVLSTLGVVAIITLVVVAFSKLGRTVDELETNVFKALEEAREELIETSNTDREQTNRQLDELRRELDSRCDKLDNKIKSSTSNLANDVGPVGNTKQVLQG
jgi:Sec-independent protein translocase protein TatA